MLELFKTIWEYWQEHLQPFTIVHAWEKGLILTLGKNPKVLEPGLRWKWPFFQQIMTENVMSNTVCPRAVHTTTLDGKTVMIEPAIEYEVTDVQAWFVNVNDAVSNLYDITRSVVSDYITDINWDDVRKKSTGTEIKKKLNKRAEEFGCRITNVMLTDICLSRVIITQV